MTRVVSAAGVFALAALAPFEATRPIVRLPGQAISSLEAIVLVSLAAWAASLARERRLPWRAPLAPEWLAFVAVMAISALGAGVLRGNALHMTGRFAAAAAIYGLVVDTIADRARLRTAIAVSAGSGVAVAVLAILEYLQMPLVLRALEWFRPNLTAVGTQLRAGGPLQYPTIASMYLEVTFGFALGLMLLALDEGSPRRAAGWFAALIVIAEAIALTFTRAGLITVALSLAGAGLIRFRRAGIDRAVLSVAAASLAIAVLVASSRSADALWLRLTSESQGAWYRARIEAPPALTFEPDRPQYVTVTATNTGRVSWDSQDDPPIFLSYHWLQSDGDGVVAYEGERTAFDRPVQPGAAATVQALVRAPQRPGRYRLEWDLAQEGRIWFSTEPDAPASAISWATVAGSAHGDAQPTRHRPARAVRPGRLVLWRAAVQMFAAHPLLGVGPDNFRLLYGSYAGLSGTDVRTHSNNMYLELLAGGGIVGAAVFAWLLRDAAALFVGACKRSDAGPPLERGAAPSQAAVNSIGVGLAAAGVAIAVHGIVDSFLSFAPTYVLFSLTLGFAAAVARGAETPADAHRV